MILCDYLPGNPGRSHADEFHNVSTTDMESVLALAREREIDYIMAYATDPATPTAAHVAETLGLPGNSRESIRKLSDKVAFRGLMRECGLRIPRFLSLCEPQNSPDDIGGLQLPVIVKPVDSSGSKGITKITRAADFPAAAAHALAFSRSKRIIVEEFFDSDGGDLHGDGFVVDGELVFSLLGDHIYHSAANPFNPTGTCWPSRSPEAVVREINRQVQQIITASGYKNGPINIEARINGAGELSIMEVGPRNGGHFVPQAIGYASGFNLVDAALSMMNGKPMIGGDAARATRPAAYCALHSDTAGTLKRLAIGEPLTPFVKEFHQYKQPGDAVRPFMGANDALGVLILQFPGMDRMHHCMDNIGSYVTIETE